MMKSNDSLLSHIITTDEKVNRFTPKYIKDEILQNPSLINVGANSVVYIHFIHCKAPDFKIEVEAPTQTLELSPDNTIDGSSNNIIRAIGNVTFKANTKDFYVQLTRIFYGLKETF